MILTTLIHWTKFISKSNYWQKLWTELLMNRSKRCCYNYFSCLKFSSVLLNKGFHWKTGPRSFSHPYQTVTDQASTTSTKMGFIWIYLVLSFSFFTALSFMLSRSGEPYVYNFFSCFIIVSCVNSFLFCCSMKGCEPNYCLYFIHRPLQFVKNKFVLNVHTGITCTWNENLCLWFAQKLDIICTLYA